MNQPISRCIFVSYTLEVEKFERVLSVDTEPVRHTFSRDTETNYYYFTFVVVLTSRLKCEVKVGVLPLK